MKKILILTAMLSIGSMNAQIIKEEPVTPAKILTIQDKEIKEIENEIKTLNESDEGIIIKYDSVEYIKEKNLFKISNVKVFDKTGQIIIPLRVGDIWTSSVEDKRNIKTYANNIRLKKSEIVDIIKSDFKKQENSTESKIDKKELEELLYQVDMIYALAGTEELIVKVSSDISSKEKNKETTMNSHIEVVDLGKFSFNLKASEVYQGIFEKGFEPENLNENQKKQIMDISIEDLSFNFSTFFNLSKLRLMVDPINYKEKINESLVSLKEEEKPLFIKEIEMNILTAIRDGKDISISVGVGKSFKVMDGVSGIMMALINPDFFIETFDIYIKSEQK